MAIYGGIWRLRVPLYTSPVLSHQLTAYCFTGFRIASLGSILQHLSLYFPTRG